MAAKSVPRQPWSNIVRLAAILYLFVLPLVIVEGQAQPGGIAPLEGSTQILRFVSQRGEKAYMREGPSYAHRVVWIYRHRGYPFALLAQFDVWRRVQAPDGGVGWINSAMLSDQRTVLVIGNKRAPITARSDGGKIMALAEPGAIADLKACKLNSCQISGPNVEGWISKDCI